MVPSRLHQGKFYALPQAPQQFKQLLMIAGFDKYFQIAPCFRDEDSRADRSPGEFYQLDFEMSFVNKKMYSMLLNQFYMRYLKKIKISKKILYSKVSKYPFPRIPYDEALEKYGTDKPDLRNPLIIKDYTNSFKNSNFKIFSQQIDKGFVVKGIVVSNTADKPRSFFDKLNALGKRRGGCWFRIYKFC